MLVIQASNIHEGGGRVLLHDLLSEILNKNTSNSNSNKLQVVLFVDKRFNIQNSFQITDEKYLKVYEVTPSIISRLATEVKIWLLAKKNPAARIFCFGNLPPLFPVKNKVILYFHTVLYFQKYMNLKTNTRLFIKHSIERFWVKLGLSSVDEVLVQSSFVKNCFEKEFGFTKTKVFPFRSNVFNETTNTTQDKTADFVYLAAGTHHKNHENLIKAWMLLSKEGIRPNLHLTIDSRYEEILNLIQNAKANFGVQIVNHGTISHQEAMLLYSSTKAIIFPSLCESFGLPLLEAKNLHIPILAGELDYVRDIVDPTESFDPTSERSIARAVMRFLKINTEKSKMHSTDELVSFLINS